MYGYDAKRPYAVVAGLMKRLAVSTKVSLSVIDSMPLDISPGFGNEAEEE